MSALVPVLAALSLVLPAQSAGDACARASAVLLRRESPPPAARTTLARELSTLVGARPCLVSAVALGRVEIAGAEARLDEGQHALALEALLASGRHELVALLERACAPGAEAVQVAAALRVAGAGPFDAACLARIAQVASGSDEIVSAAYEQALVDLLGRTPHAHALLEGWWPQLPEEFAAAALRALSTRKELAGLECVTGWIGLRPSLDEAALTALAALAHFAHLGDRGRLTSELIRLAEQRLDLEHAIVLALGRLQDPSALPFLITRLDSVEPPTARAALAALRLVARTRLSSSASAWRAWLAREERWWQERAPERLALLADDTTLAVGDVHRLVGELCAHPLQREALAPALAPLLGHSDPAVRVIGCQALATLGARSGAPLLYPLLRGGPVEVVTAARSALVAITGVEWRGTPEVMAQRLAARGFFALD